MKPREFNWLKLKENFGIIAETMAIEIEAKLKVDSHKQVIKRLKKLGAEFLSEHIQKDQYFDDVRQTLTKTDRGIRLRRQKSGNEEKIFLTYKGAREKDRFKKRQEIEMEITDGDSVEKLLFAMGYEKAIVFEKKRRVYRLGGCEVALDELPLLGSFVEIEGPDGEKIADVQKNLGLSDLPSIKESYAGLMAAKLKAGRSQQ
jgi:adenylate cyclase class 2